MTTLNPGDTYRFKIIDDISGALDYDQSLNWLHRNVCVEFTDDYDRSYEIPYDGNRMVTVTIPDGVQSNTMRVSFRSTCMDLRDPQYYPHGIVSGYDSKILTFTV